MATLMHKIVCIPIAFNIMQAKARQGKARQGKARQGKARQGKARQGKASQATHCKQTQCRGTQVYNIAEKAGKAQNHRSQYDASVVSDVQPERCS